MFFESEQKNKLVLDYYDTHIQSIPFEKTPTNGGYIKIPFQNSKSIINPNLILSRTNEKYRTERLYIISNCHSIKNIDYNGELIIEHRSLTNPDKTVYMVFLLKSDPSIISFFKETNDIDNIINASMTNTPINLVLNINLLLSSRNRIIGNNNVFIFEEPIYVTSSFESFKIMENFIFSKNIDIQTNYNKSNDIINGPIYEGNADSSSALNIDTINADVSRYQQQYGPQIAQMSSIIQADIKKSMNIDTSGNNQEGGNVQRLNIGDSAYMECSPTGTSIDTIEMYNIPVNGEFASDLGKISLYRLVITMFVMLIFIFFITLLVPTIYKQFVIYYLIMHFIKDENEQPKFLIVVDYIIVILVFCAAVVITQDGMAKESDNTTIFGFFMFLFIIFSIFIIQIYKQNSALEYNLSVTKVAFEMGILLRIFYSTIGILWRFIGFLLVILLVFCALIMTYYYYFESGSEDLWKYIYSGWTMAFVLSVIITLVYNADDED